MPRRCIGELAEFLFKHRGQSDTSVNKECSEYAQRVGSSPAISASLDRNWRTMGFQELYEKWVTVVPYCPCTEVQHGRLLCGQRLMPDHGTGPCKACLARGVTVLTHKTVRQAEGGKQAEVEPVDLDYFIDPGKQVAEFLMDPEFVASLEESWPTVIHGLSQGTTNKKAKINGMLTGRHARRVYEENTALVKMDIREGRYSICQGNGG
jgi:hypothetical protein